MVRGSKEGDRLQTQSHHFLWSHYTTFKRGMIKLLIQAQLVPEVRYQRAGGKCQFLTLESTELWAWMDVVQRVTCWQVFTPDKQNNVGMLGDPIDRRMSHTQTMGTPLTVTWRVSQLGHQSDTRLRSSINQSHSSSASGLLQSQK